MGNYKETMTGLYATIDIDNSEVITEILQISSMLMTAGGSHATREQVVVCP